MVKPKFSLNQLIWALQLSLAVAISFYVADSFHLQFAAASGIIAMLASITLRNKTTFTPAIFEWYLSIGIGSLLILLYEMISHNLLVLFLMLFLFFLILLAFDLTECMVISTVVVTHYFGVGKLSIAMVQNEFFLLTIGVSVAVSLTLLARFILKNRKQV